jgi:hypothetical protein
MTTVAQHGWLYQDYTSFECNFRPANSGAALKPDRDNGDVAPFGTPGAE